MRKKFLFLTFLFSFVFADSNINWKITSQWNDWYCYELKIWNNYENTINNWNLSFDIWNTKISNYWNWKFLCEKWLCKVYPLEWNQKILPNKEIVVWFCVNWLDKPSNIKFNSNFDSFQTWFNLQESWLKISVKTQNEWNNWYCRVVELSALNKITNWKLEFELDNGKIYTNWSSNIEKKWSKYIVSPKSWNQQFNSKTSFWFCVEWYDKDKNWKILLVNSSQDDWDGWSNDWDQTTWWNNNWTWNNLWTWMLSWNISLVWDLILKYPDEAWPTYKSQNFILEINPWNINYPAEGFAKMYFDWKSIVTYVQDLKNIEIINPGWYVLWYPEIYVGNKPWNWKFVKWKSNLPSKIENLESLIVKSRWLYNHPNNLSCNFAMEGWFTKNQFQNSWVWNKEVEMMIMRYKNIQWPAWQKVWETVVPIVFNWKNIDVKFDIYLAHIGWDFITFVPQNYQDFKNVDLEFDVLKFVNIAKKYLPQIQDLYLEDWELGTEYWTPNTNEASFEWQVQKFEVIWFLKSKTTTKTDTDLNSKIDYVKTKFNDFLNSLKNKVSQEKYIKTLNLLKDKLQFYYQKSENKLIKNLFEDLINLINYKLNKVD